MKVFAPQYNCKTPLTLWQGPFITTPAIQQYTAEVRLAQKLAVSLLDYGPRTPNWDIGISLQKAGY